MLELLYDKDDDEGCYVVRDSGYRRYYQGRDLDIACMVFAERVAYAMERAAKEAAPEPSPEDKNPAPTGARPLSSFNDDDSPF